MNDIFEVDLNVNILLMGDFNDYLIDKSVGELFGVRFFMEVSVLLYNLFYDD